MLCTVGINGMNDNDKTITSKLPVLQYLSCDSKILQLLQCMQCGFMLSAFPNLHQRVHELVMYQQ